MTRWEVIRPYLTSEEQVNFITDYADSHPSWVRDDLNGEATGQDLIPHKVLSRSFVWLKSYKGQDYWESVHSRIKSQWEEGQIQGEGGQL